jgi:hypothetical protein
MQCLAQSERTNTTAARCGASDFANAHSEIRRSVPTAEAPAFVELTDAANRFSRKMAAALRFMVSVKSVNAGASTVAAAEASNSSYVNRKWH